MAIRTTGRGKATEAAAPTTTANTKRREATARSEHRSPGPAFRA